MTLGYVLEFLVGTATLAIWVMWSRRSGLRWWRAFPMALAGGILAAWISASPWTDLRAFLWMAAWAMILLASLLVLATWRSVRLARDRSANDPGRMGQKERPNVWVWVVICAAVVGLVGFCAGRPAAPVDGDRAEALVTEFLDKFLSEHWREARPLVSSEWWNPRLDRRIMVDQANLHLVGLPEWTGSYVMANLYGERHGGSDTYTATYRFYVEQRRSGELVITYFDAPYFAAEQVCTRGPDALAPCPKPAKSP